ncbi:MAG: hypothetical protein P1U58_15745 [Verrucomicrobiales bacterium]|nr:hypothetical protein [Verrucomicrobiales bacterium]
MQFPLFLAASTRAYDSPLFALFLAFAIAAVIWLIIWLLSAGETEGVASAAPKKSPRKKEGTPEPVKEASKSSSERPEGTDPDFKTASSEEAAGLFASELSSGLVKQDPVYGIVYQSAPDDVDDLKKIKGVAKVLEGKLHGIGVYQFKQVAVWTDEACAEFSKLLTFKNRIYTDNWLAQAKAFHEDKYGEKL